MMSLNITQPHSGAASSMQLWGKMCGASVPQDSLSFFLENAVGLALRATLQSVEPQGAGSFSEEMKYMIQAA
jgi:hypothetical protein